MKTNLHNYQLDFVKVKLFDVDQSKINWEAFEPHPVLKNHYYYYSSLEQDYYGKNFDLYINKGGHVIIRMSIPYFLTNQNYFVDLDFDLQFMLCHLSIHTGIDFPEAKVKEFEYGAYEYLSMNPSDFISRIIGVLDYDLKYSSKHMKMFGTQNLDYKIYDAKANSKVKKTYTRSNFPKGTVIKHELKIKNPRHLLGKDITIFSLSSEKYDLELREQLDLHRENLVLKQGIEVPPLTTSLNHILFSSLKNIEQGRNLNIVNEVVKVINNANLTSSQKSKRKKSLMTLESEYNKAINNPLYLK